MTNIMSSLYSMKAIDDLSSKDSSIHNLNPISKLITSFLCLFFIASFGKHEVIRILPFFLYPIVIFGVSELPVKPIIKKVLLVEPLIIGIGILNPILDHQVVLVGDFIISRGWITFLSIFIKCGLTVTISILLIATTGIEKLALGLRTLKVPKIFVLQLLLTYRYIAVLIEEISTMQCAYSLRAPMQKGVDIRVCGSFAGQLIIRTFERAQRVYQAMNLRGFTGEYNTGISSKMKIKDYGYIFIWTLFFIIARIYNIPMMMGVLFTGVIK